LLKDLWDHFAVVFYVVRAVSKKSRRLVHLITFLLQNKESKSTNNGRKGAKGAKREGQTG
jgi:hypothetical protein